jgi:hypothetical protein
MVTTSSVLDLFTTLSVEADAFGDDLMEDNIEGLGYRELDDIAAAATALIKLISQARENVYSLDPDVDYSRPSNLAHRLDRF